VFVVIGLFFACPFIARVGLWLGYADSGELLGRDYGVLGSCIAVLRTLCIKVNKVVQKRLRTMSSELDGSVSEAKSFKSYITPCARTLGGKQILRKLFVSQAPPPKRGVHRARSLNMVYKSAA